jgi:hypothetical protein
MTPTRNAALAYHRRGWNVLPIASGTKRPAIKWSRWIRDRQSAADVGGWFSGDAGVAVILGPVSSDTYVRDFDVADAYQHWRDRHGDLAGTLPTVATRRGHHVYFRHTDRLTTRKFDDGELRGDGSYVLAPPSRHPEGGSYDWQIPLGDVLPIVDPVTAGLCVDTVLNQPAPDCTEVVRLSSSVSSVFVCPRLYTVTENAEEIARFAVPTTPHTNNRLLFRLARYCKTIGQQRGCDLTASELKAVFDAWHRLAAMHLRPDQSRDEYYFEFLNGFGKVKHGIGDSVTAAWKAAKESPLPASAKEFADPQVQLLVGLCQQLQRLAGSQPFFLSSRTVAKLLGHDTHSTAATWLRGLVASGVLKIVEAGGPRTNKATRYHFNEESAQ